MRVDKNTMLLVTHLPTGRFLKLALVVVDVVVVGVVVVGVDVAG